MMRRWLFVTFMSATSIIQTGCAIVSSSKLNPDSAQETKVGIPYMLPKAVIPYQVVASGSQLRIDLQTLAYVGDSSQVFALTYKPGHAATDSVKIAVDPATSLLKSVSLDSKDETLEILKKTIATIRAEAAEAEVVLAQGVIDPGSADSISAAQRVIKKAAATHLKVHKAKCTKAMTDGCDEVLAQSEDVTVDIGVSLLDAGSQAVETAGAVKVQTNDLGFKASAKAASSNVDCTVGICIRSTLPYEVSITALGRRSAALVQLPNHGPVTALQLSRYPFVKTTHSVILKNGMVEQYDVTKPSSLFALVSWPLEVFDEIVTTTAKIIQLKIDTSKNDLKLQEQMVAEAEQRKLLKDRLEKLLTQPESASLTAGSTKAIASVSTSSALTFKPPRLTNPDPKTVVIPPNGGSNDGTVSK